MGKEAEEMATRKNETDNNVNGVCVSARAHGGGARFKASRYLVSSPFSHLISSLVSLWLLKPAAGATEAEDDTRSIGKDDAQALVGSDLLVGLISVLEVVARLDHVARGKPRK